MISTKVTSDQGPQDGGYSRTTTILAANCGPDRVVDISTPMKALRAKCLDCSGGSAHEVRYCPVSDCPLFPYRLGSSPFRPKRKQRDAAANPAEKPPIAALQADPASISAGRYPDTLNQRAEINGPQEVETE